jgi:hypothetical protein
MGSLRDTGRAAVESARCGGVERCVAWLEEAARAGLEGADAETRAVGVQVLGATARHAALGLDGARVGELHDRMRALRVEGGVAAVTLELVGAWRALLSGEDALATELSTRAASRAAELRDAELLVEAHALTALSRLARGEVAEGLRVARRASRMARTEAIPASEALAHLVLARARRESGHPHLALRITRSLATFAIPSHRAWLALERGLAGGTEREAHADARVAPLAGAGEALRTWVSAAEAGRIDPFEDATRTLLSHARRLPRFVARELEGLVTATDARLDPAGSPVGAFLLGAGAELPPALQGLATLRGVAGEGETAIVYVASFAPDRARRVVRLGRALAASRLTTLKQTRMKQGRTETVVAALLLAGPSGLPEEECFRAVYGFAFVPELHRGAFDVTLHRAREWLGELGTLERRAGSVTLAPQRALLCPDPRCSGSVSDKILVALADQGVRSAKEIADATGVPLRAVQAALAELVEDGACDARPGQGRAVEYFVEDTTFTEPTAAG